MIKTPILIVGAGPTGLMLSAQLLRYGAPHVIVDKKDGVTELSKALAVQARTLEQYRQLGIADEAIATGFVAQNMRLIVNGCERATVPFGQMGAGLSPYPFIFILEQSQNEKLILDHVEANGGGVEWASEVVDLQRNGGGYTGAIRRRDGSNENFECDYLIGCGGASSPVRQFLGMPFRGGTNEQIFFVADIDMEIGLEKQGLLLAINNSEFLAFFPMSRPQQYRAIGVLPPSITDPDNLTFDQLRDHIENNAGVPLKVTGHSWQACYRVHHRIVDCFRSDNAFLVGDAAHIHSPAGGQGMNTGLGDAANLGWKLAAVVNGWCGPQILNSYDQERRPFAVQLVHTTDRAFSMVVSKNWLPRFFRTRIVPTVMSRVLRSNMLRRLMFKTVSQTRITYRNSSLSDKSRSGSLHSGDRFPWFEWNGGNSYDWLTHTGYVVLSFGDAPACEVPDWKGPSTKISVNGAAAAVAAEAGLPSRGVVIVRPDMHIAKIVNEP